MRPLITLTTDFGERDPYVAAMKGVILSIAPESNILDLSHEIAPQDICEAAYFLREALPYFPKGSIHLVVVDPGVGTGRNALAVNLDGRIVICPDNGLLGLVKEVLPIRNAIILDAARFVDRPISATFHGRDLFAPAAARIAAGGRMEHLGDTIETIVERAWAQPKRLPGGPIEGEVIHIDRFGNCITNIPASWIPSKGPGGIRVMDTVVTRWVETYGAASVGDTIALVSSGGLLEVAVNQGDAASEHGIERGAGVSMILDMKSSTE